jgi:hypothetical protein
MKLAKHSPAAIAEMRDDLSPDVQETAERFSTHLTIVPESEVRSTASSLPLPPARNPFLLKKLTQKHKDMVVLSLQGLSRDKVAEVCGCTPEYVTMIARQPLAKAYIAELEEHMDLRLRGLYEKSIDAIQAGLASPKVSDKLAAAQIQMAAVGKSELPAGKDNQTAEDVVGAMLIQAGSVQVNIGGK